MLLEIKAVRSGTKVTDGSVERGAKFGSLTLALKWEQKPAPWRWRIHCDGVLQTLVLEIE
jgi:hypothetical protein